MSFLANVFWIAFGLAMIALSRSYYRTGPPAIAGAIGAVGLGAVAAGLFL